MGPWLLWRPGLQTCHLSVIEVRLFISWQTDREVHKIFLLWRPYLKSRFIPVSGSASPIQHEMGQTQMKRQSKHPKEWLCFAESQCTNMLIYRQEKLRTSLLQAYDLCLSIHPRYGTLIKKPKLSSQKGHKIKFSGSFSGSKVKLISPSC